MGEGKFQTSFCGAQKNGGPLNEMIELVCIILGSLLQVNHQLREPSPKPALRDSCPKAET